MLMWQGVFNCTGFKVRGIYSDYCFNVSDKCGSYKKEGDCYNREHTW